MHVELQDWRRLAQETWWHMEWCAHKAGFIRWQDLPRAVADGFALVRDARETPGHRNCAYRLISLPGAGFYEPPNLTPRDEILPVFPSSDPCEIAAWIATGR